MRMHEEAVKLAGLKKFLLEFSRIDEKGAIEVKMWDEYLIFAQIFGIADKVSKQFKKLYPDRYYNMGIAEQNMIGVAAGLAMRGKKPYVYSIIPFLIMRSYEQVRVDICYHNLDIKLIGSGGGVAYGPAGATHHAIEDLSLMRGLPNMDVISPGDPYEAKNALQKSYENNNPTYIRLSKNNEPMLHSNLKDENFKIGKSICMKEGKNIAIVLPKAA